MVVVGSVTFYLATMTWFMTWLVLSAAVWLTALVLPGFELRGGPWGAFKVAALIGILNFLLGKLIFVVIGLGTLGIGFLLAFITRWIVSAILLKVAAGFSSSLEIKSFGRALLGAAIMSFVGTLAEALLLSSI